MVCSLMTMMSVMFSVMRFTFAVFHSFSMGMNAFACIALMLTMFFMFSFMSMYTAFSCINFFIHFFAFIHHHAFFTFFFMTFMDITSWVPVASSFCVSSFMTFMPSTTAFRSTMISVMISSSSSCLASFMAFMDIASWIPMAASTFSFSFCLSFLMTLMETF